MKKQAHFERIYQFSDGNFLPDTSQPDPSAAYAITSTTYTPHHSTRYVNVSANTGKNLPQLYESREKCCGCTACFSICPVNAIVMRPDEEGFLYPVVDAKICIQCGQCIKICAFHS